MPCYCGSFGAFNYMYIFLFALDKHIFIVDIYRISMYNLINGVVDNISYNIQEITQYIFISACEIQLMIYKIY